MIPQNLKEEYESFKAKKKEPAYYFRPDTMKFFGDTMSNYRVIEENIGGVEYWVLCRKKPVKKSHQPAGPAAWFNKVTFQIHKTRPVIKD